VLVDNERQRRPDVRIFEIGSLHHWEGGAPSEAEVVGLLLAGADEPLGVGRPNRAADVASLKGMLEAIVTRLTGARVTYAPRTPRDGVDHPGRTAAVIGVAMDGRTMEIGWVGELHPALLRAWEVRAERVIAAELSLAALPTLRPERQRIGLLEHLPAIERDLAFVVRAGTPAGEVEAVIRDAGGPDLRDVRLFDLYEGPPLEPGERSLAYRLRYRSGAPSVEPEIDASIGTIVREISGRFGARLRS
jgi:phenylalanyl-tRNA synthetase beta chain